MTTKPQLELGSHLVSGLAAIALFVVMAVAFMSTSFPRPRGFPEGASITASIGYAMFNLDAGSVPAESFLVPFEIIDVLLVAALVGAVMLARREEEGRTVTLLVDGGRRLRETLSFGDDDGEVND